MSDRPLPLPDETARRRAVSTFDRPLLVEAGAGTGKTSTLVARTVAWVLSSGWERATHEAGSGATAEQVASAAMRGVVAITFTEAAAAEMAGRVGTALAELAASGGTCLLPDGGLPLAGEDARSRSRALLVALDQMVVCTIHAYCRRLLALHPLEAGLHPAFTVDADERALDDAARDAVVGWLRDAGSDRDLLLLARRALTADQIVAAVRELLRAGVPAGALRSDPADCPATAAVVAMLRAAAVALEGLLSGPAERSRRARNLVRLREAAAAIAAAISTGTGPLAARTAAGGALDENLAKHLRKWSQGGFGPEEGAALGECAGEVRAVAAALWRARTALVRWDPELLDAARRVLAAIVDTARGVLDRRGMVTFQDLLRRARDLLRDHPRVASSVRREIRQLLVDEFQDTDPIQCDLVRLLAATGPKAERPGLFLVGDPKQSIYGWRGADLAAYQEFIASLGPDTLEVVSLDANFRSEARLLAEVGRIVEPVMIEARGVQPPFRPLLATVPDESAAWRAAPRWAPVEHWVSWLAPDAETHSHEATALEARALAADIAGLHEHGVGWGEVGVLFRTSSDLDVYLEELRLRGIPYQVEKDRSYYQRREVIEAAALVRFIIDPCDQLAMVCWLRSASVGVPDAALVPLWRGALPALLSDLREPDPEREAAVATLASAVAAALPDCVPGLAGVAGWELALTAAARNLARLRLVFRSGTAHALVEELRALTLVEATEAARTAGPFRIANLARFFRRLEAALEEPGADAGAVLRFLRTAVQEQREETGTRAGLSPSEAVTVTTIHGAKGLEFGHVYLMQTHKAAAGSSRHSSAAEAAELPTGWEYRALGTQTPGWAQVEENRRLVADAELVRLLYVSLTRAKRRLVVAGAWAGAGRSAREATLARLLESRSPSPPDLAGLWLQAASERRHWVDTADARWVFPALRPADATAPERKRARDRTGAGLPTPISDLAAARAEALERMGRRTVEPASAEAHRAAALDASDEGWSGPPREVATAVGSAIHGVLEALNFAADLGAELTRLAMGAERRLGAELPSELLPAALTSFRTLLEGLRRPPWRERLAGLAERVVARELPLLLPGSSPGRAVAGLADVLARDGDGFVVIDYKTDAVEAGPELAARAAAYARQGAIYTRAVAEALGLAAAPRCELWFLRAGEIVVV